MATVLAEAGIVFMFAPLLHPAMRHVGPVRRGLGVATMMNILGPLTNPAGARRQVVGVADPRLLDLVPGALLELGHLHALVVHGEPGLDEVSPFGITRVAELKEGRIERYEISPAELGLESHSLGALSGGSLSGGSLAGGDPSENAALIERILVGQPGAARDAVVANAAAALLVGDAAASWSEAARLAEATLDRGGAGEALERLRTASREAR
jgi:anthranilate phosphoribosyltransferase